MAGTIAPLWAQQQTNALAGWQNMASMFPSFMQQYWSPSQFLLGSGMYQPGAGTTTTPPPATPAAATSQLPSWHRQPQPPTPPGMGRGSSWRLGGGGW